MTDLPKVDSQPPFSNGMEPLPEQDLKIAVDKEFLARHPTIDYRALKDLRVIEDNLKQEKVNDPLDLVAETVGTIVGYLCSIAGPEAIPVATHQMKEVVESVAKKGSTATKRAYISTTIADGYLLPCLAADPIATEAALRPFLYERGNDVAAEVASQILTLRYLRVVRRPVEENKFSYYGLNCHITLPEVGKSYSASELVLGILALYDDKTNKVVGILDVHPDNFLPEQTEAETPVISPSDLFKAIGLQDPANFSQNAERFFEEFTTFFADEPSANSQYPSIWNCWRTFAHPNTNFIPLEAKYYLWRFLSPNSPSYKKEIAEATSLILNEFPEAVWFIQSLEGKTDLILPLVKKLQEVSLSEETTLRIEEMVSQVAEVEKFIIEAAATIIPQAERTPRAINERINFLLPTSRKLAQEATTSITQIKNEEELREALDYHRSGIFALIETIRYIYQTHADIKRGPRPFDPSELTRLQDGYTHFPHASGTYNMALTQWLAHTIADQQGISEEERKKWLWDFYRHVVALGVYQEKAAVYADISGIEAERWANAIMQLAKEGYEGIRLPSNFTYLTVGCGDGKRVEEPVFNRLRQEMPEIKPGEIVGVDMMEQSEESRWPQMQFIRAEIENLLADYPELRNHFDLVAAIGSPLNNMDLLSVQIKYFLAMAACLKQGGVLMCETGSPIPVESLNERLIRMKEFNRLFPYKPYGAIGMIPAYQRPEDRADETGAFIYPHPIILFLAKLAGLRMIVPTADPVGFQKLKEGLQDPLKLKEATLSQRNAILQPFYIPNPDDWQEGQLVNTRVAYFFVREAEPDPLFDNFLQPLLAASKGQTKA